MIHGVGHPASRALAGHVGAPAQVDRPGSGIAIFIMGMDRTGFLKDKALSVSEELGGRGRCQFKLVDPSGNYHVDVGMPVDVYFDGAVVFSGTIDSYKENITIGGDPTLFTDARCVDWNQLADRHVVTTIYEDSTIREIVTDIIDTQSGAVGETLASDGVHYDDDSITSDTTIIDRVVFNYEYCSDAFDAIAELTGYSWWIDYRKKMHFHEPEKYIAPYTLDDAFWKVYAKMRHTEDRKDYRNVQILRGGKARTADLTSDLAKERVFKGDGENKVFGLDYKLAEKPELYIDTGSGYVQVSASDIGQRNNEADEDLEWHYELDTEDVSQNQDDTFTPLSSTDKLKVKFVGYFPIVAEARDEAQIASRLSVEGGSGVYVNVEEEETLDDQALARQRAEGLLLMYGRIPKRIEFQSTAHGFHAGQMLDINQPQHRAGGAYIVERVSFRTIADDPVQPFRYRIKAVFERFAGNWIRFYKRWMLRGRPWTINENEKVDIRRTLISGISASDTLTVQTGDQLFDWELDFFTWSLSGDLINNVGSYIGYAREDADASTGTLGSIVGPMYGPREEYFT